MIELAFTVPGLPVPKERPRLGKRGHVYTPRATSSFERTVGAFALRAMALAGWRRPRDADDRFALTANVYWPDARRRDLDNVVKAVADSLNGLVYIDDSQIDELHAFGAIDRERPRVEIRITATWAGSPAPYANALLPAH